VKPLLVILGGPTGIGKTSTGIQLAKHFNTEIISADSRQFYKELSIGTAVPTEDELNQVKHYFIHNLSVDTYYNASQFETDALKLLKKLFEHKPVVFMVGGSGLYIDAVCSGIDYLPTISKEVRIKYDNLFKEKGIEEIKKRVEEIDPDYYMKVDKNNHKRMLKSLEVFEMTGLPYSSFLTNKHKEREFNVLMLILNIEREELYQRINLRVDKMVESGLIDEAKRMLAKKDLTPLKTVGYKELFDFFEGNISKAEAITQIKNHTRAYARRQLTWFRKYPDAQWFNPEEVNKMVDIIGKQIQN
jgi:tRNA dimethylallyltransferase